jgi:hypothetical protein
MPGGLLNDQAGDYERLRESVRRIVDRFAGPGNSWNDFVRFVEIGIHEGKTSDDLILEIRNRLSELRAPVRFFYYGIDPFAKRPPFTETPDIPDVRFIHIPMFSHEAYKQFAMKNSVHWVFVDGCHCAQCVTRDIELYAPLLPPGGEMAFHDTLAHSQLEKSCPQGYEGDFHDYHEAMKGVNVRHVLDTVMANRSDFKLIVPAPTDTAIPWGGVEIYEKIP